MGYLIDYKYYKWVAIIPGWILGDFIGSIAAFFLVRELMTNKDGVVTYELALLKICSQLIKVDGEVTENEVKFGFVPKNTDKKDNLKPNVSKKY